MLPDFEQHSLKWKYINGSVWGNSAPQTAERRAHSCLCPQPFDGIIMWTSLGRITAYIYHRNCLIWLSLLYPVGFRRKALLAHSVYNLFIHWCGLNKPKPLKWANHMARKLEKVLPSHWIFKLGLEKMDDLCNEVLSSVRNSSILLMTTIWKSFQSAS